MWTCQIDWQKLIQNRDKNVQTKNKIYRHFANFGILVSYHLLNTWSPNFINKLYILKFDVGIKMSKINLPIYYKYYVEYQPKVTPPPAKQSIPYFHFV